jgi:catechol 2,3-dioxygenase-like lactoylglutathione lyase family enzyme
MKLLIRAVCALLLLAAGDSFAQLPAGNAAGVATGHIHLAVTDTAKAKAIWLAFGAKDVKNGNFQALGFPGIYVMLAQRAPTASSAGSVVDHVGFAVKDLALYKQKLLDNGAKVVAENANLGLVIGELPEGTLVEFRSEPTIANPIEFHHFHLKSADPDALQTWYIDTFGAEKSTRMNLPSAVVPGGRVDFLKATPDKPTEPSKGRAIDHIGFEVNDLDSFAARLRAKGIKFDREPAMVEAIGVKIAFITDPAGTYIELTQGLRGK